MKTASPVSTPWFDGWFHWTQGNEKEEEKLDLIALFQLVLLAHLTAEFWDLALYQQEALGRWHPGLYLPAAASSLIALAGIDGRLRRPSFALLCVLYVGIITFLFPFAGNHLLLLCVFAGLSALLNPREPRERDLFLQTARWIVVIVFFYSGMQKLLHGYYFRGELFAYYTMTQPSYRSLLEWFAPAEEFSRLASYGWDVGAGPYRFTSPLILLVSNAVYLSELALAPLLVIRRTRTAALIASAFMIVAIEIAARELFFGALFFNGLLLFGRPKINRVFFIPFLIFYAWLLLMRLHILPMVAFQ